MEQDTSLGSLTEPEYTSLVTEILDNLGSQSKVRSSQQRIELELWIPSLKVIVLAQAQIQILHQLL